MLQGFCNCQNCRKQCVGPDWSVWHRGPDVGVWGDGGGTKAYGGHQQRSCERQILAGNPAPQKCGQCLRV